MADHSHRRRRSGAVTAALAALAACGVDGDVAVMSAVPIRPEAPTTMELTPTTAASSATSETDAPSTTVTRPRVSTVTTVLCSAALTVTACAGESAEPQPAEPEVCTVSDLLVPSCGAWFGVSSPSSDGEYDYTRGLAEYRSYVSEPPDVLRFFERGDAPFPDREHRTLAAPAGEQRAILHFSWKPSLERSWREIADGAADAALDTVAASLSAYPHRMFLTIHHEPENDVIADPASGMTATDYVDMYRHVVAGLRERGVDNVVYVMTYIGFERWAGLIDDLYPGDDVVDWIAWDPYAVDEIESFGDLVNNPGDDWPGFYEWAVEKRPDTPFMLAEWGFNLPAQPWAVDTIADTAEALDERFPAVKAIVYWNDRGSRFDSRLRSDDANADEFAQALATVAADPFFNRVSTADVPAP